MSFQFYSRQKHFGVYNKNSLLTIIIIIILVIVSTISATDVNENCYFRSGRRMFSGKCIPASSDKCCRDQHYGIGICPDSRHICCFHYDSDCNKDSSGSKTESKSIEKLLLSRIVRQTRHGEKLRKFRTNFHIVEMPEHMQTDAIDFVSEALEQYGDDFNEAADYLCRMFEKKYHEIWSCVIGPNFGFSVEPEPGKYMDFHIGNVNRIRVMAFVAKS